jgi:hypothetical protein
MNQLIKQIVIAVGVVGMEKVINYIIARRKVA